MTWIMICLIIYYIICDYINYMKKHQVTLEYLLVFIYHQSDVINLCSHSEISD